MCVVCQRLAVAGYPLAVADCAFAEACRAVAVGGHVLATADMSLQYLALPVSRGFFDRLVGTHTCDSSSTSND